MNKQPSHYTPCCLSKWVRAIGSLLLATSLLGISGLPAAENRDDAGRENVREIFVPFESLHVLLRNQQHRVLLSRDEYEQLLEEAKQSPEARTPHAAVLLSADYDAEIRRERLELTGRLAIDVLRDGLQAVPLDLGGVGLQDAQLDGTAAAIWQDPAGKLRLFVEGIGRHELTLKMVAPLETTAARQMLNFRLPRPAAARMRLTVPGDVELKSGAEVVRREMDEAAGVTRFELLPQRGDTTLLMTLNSRLLRTRQVVVARSVLVDEVTEAYEKLHATVSMVILHRAVDRFRFLVPEGFEITQINSPLLARWDLEDDGPRKILNVHLSEQTTETVRLNIAAVKTSSQLDDWHMPRLEPLDVVGQVAVVGLLVQEQLAAESVRVQGLIPVDVSALKDLLPDSVFHAAAGTPPLRPVVAYYGPQADFELSATFRKPDARLTVRGNVLLILEEKQHQVRGGLALVPEVDKLFQFDLTVPAGWNVTSVVGANESPLRFERYGSPDEPSRIRVRLGRGVAPGEEYTVNFHAISTPDGWLGRWESFSAEFPKFAVAGAARQLGAVAVEVRDDMTVRPEKLQQLTPLDEPDKAKYGLANVATNLAYRYENPAYTATLVVGRTRPRLTAQTFSFLRVEPDALAARYELIYDVQEARTRTLELLLPESTTPETLSIRGIGGLPIRQYDSHVDGSVRRWRVQLEEPRRGRMHLAVDFRHPVPEKDLKDFALPIVEAGGVARQSGLVAVEGSAELDVQVKTKARTVDVGELVDAEYQPGRRLLGAHKFVGPPGAELVKIDVVRHPGYRLPSAIVEKAQLSTYLSPGRRSQTRAEFVLRTKALFLEVELPKQAELWSAHLDGSPIKPQREDSSLLIGLPAGTGERSHALRLVYEMPCAALGYGGRMNMPAPKLMLRGNAKAASVEVPLNDLYWDLHLPAGYTAVQSGGTLATDQLTAPRPAAVEVAEWLYWLAGEVDLGWGIDQRARQLAQLSEQAAYDSRLSHYQDAATDIDYPDEPPIVYPDADAWDEEHARRAEKYKSMSLASMGPAEKKIRDALKSPTKLEFVETPLQDVVDHLKDHHQIEIQIDQKSLDDVGIGTDTPVTKNLKGISLRSALRLTLRELDLTYAIQDGVLLITTPEEAENRLETKVYPVADLVAAVDPSGERWADFDSLIEIISSTVRPETWDEVGGPGGIKGFETNLSVVISQTQDVHEEIDELLTKIRSMPRGELDESKLPVRRKPKPGEMGQSFGGMGGGGFGGGMGGFGTLDGGEITVMEPNGADALVPSSLAAGQPSVEPTVRQPPQTERTAGEGFIEVIEGPVRPAKRRLHGVRSLDIDPQRDVLDSGQVVRFRSLGVEPRLEVTVVDQSRHDMLAWALALAVGLIGMALTNRPLRTKTRFVVVVALVAAVAPLLLGSIETIESCNMLFFAAALLVPYYLLAAVVCWLFQAIRGRPEKTASVATAAMLLCAVMVPAADAAKPASGSGQYVIQVVEPDEPVEVPDDAIILPYDPESKTGILEADKLMVPYAKYEELWNRAHPDKKIGTSAAPAPYGLAGASYETILAGDEYLLISGYLDLDVYADGYVEIPLGLSGGVLALAELDGKPARLSVAQTDEPAPPGKQALPGSSLAVLYVRGKGRHRLELAVRMRLSRQGGWRVTHGRLPAAAATSLVLVVPKAGTDVRLGQVTDRRSYETEAANERIETSPGPNGGIGIQWRPKVAAAEVDRSLTAESTAVVDVQEDGLRLVWQLDLKFDHARREQFTVEVPQDYLVEKVEGGNVRGWSRDEDQPGKVEVTLLKAAKDREGFTLRLSRGGAVGRDELAEFDVPLVTVPDAALHEGRLTIRRSPLLQLRTLERSHVGRTDPGDDAERLAGGADNEESPLGIRPYQAYRFASVPFQIRLAAAPIEPRVTAEVQSVLKIADYEQSLESRVVFDVRDGKIYTAKILLPEQIELQRVSAPGDFQWALAQQDGRPLLTVYLAAGRQGKVPVLVEGILGRQAKVVEFALPRLEVLEVESQRGDVAVQVDPAIDVEARDLENCEVVLPRKLHGWLNPGQRRVTRLPLHYSRSDYRGTLRLTKRTPVVTCSTTSNVKLTDEAIEETIFLDFDVQQAGTSRLSFLLPEWMKDCRIKVPLLREKTIEPIQGAGGKSMLRVEVELQDEVMGKLRVIVENDRLLKSGEDQLAPIAVVITGRTDRRFVALEAAGRDEVEVVGEPSGMEPLSRRQEEWQALSAVLGGGISRAYLVDPDATDPRLVFRTKRRETVKTAGARIGLAETVLVLDANGAYRAQVSFQVDNRIEQFLEIELPRDANLWTARVAGNPVKPTKVPGSKGSRHVRIPLVKTAPGDLDYQVVLYYGGKMPAPGRLGSVDFPLVHTQNISVERSQAEVYVPKTHNWFDFGGTMGLVTDRADQAAGYVAYQTKQAERLVQTARDEGAFATARAYNNLKQLGVELQRFQETSDGYAPNANLEQQWQTNTRVMEEARQQLEELQSEAEQVDVVDNRDRMNTLFLDQKVTRSRNVVQDIGGNWSGVAQPEPTDGPVAGRGFNPKWLDSNKFLNLPASSMGDKSGKDKGPSAGNPVVMVRSWNSGDAKKTPPRQQSQPSVPQIAQGKAQQDLTKNYARQQMDLQQERQSGRGRERDKAARYQEKLTKQAALQAVRGSLDRDVDRSVSGREGRELQLFGRADPATRPQRGNAVAWSSNGRRVVTSSGDSTTRVMAVETARGADQEDTIVLRDRTASMPGGATGLVSLDLQLPQRDGTYQVYRFTTPRGKTEITARAVSSDLLTSLMHAAVILAIIAAAAYLVRLGRTGRLNWLLGRGGSTALILVGIASLIGCILPWAGGLLLIAGIVLKIRRRAGKKPEPIEAEVVGA